MTAGPRCDLVPTSHIARKITFTALTSVIRLLRRRSRLGHQRSPGSVHPASVWSAVGDTRPRSGQWWAIGFGAVEQCSSQCYLAASTANIVARNYISQICNRERERERERERKKTWLSTDRKLIYFPYSCSASLWLDPRDAEAREGELLMPVHERLEAKLEPRKTHRINVSIPTKFLNKTTGCILAAPRGIEIGATTWCEHNGRRCCSTRDAMQHRDSCICTTVAASLHGWQIPWCYSQQRLAISIATTYVDMV